MASDSVIRSGTNRPLQRRHVTHGWTDARRATFLDHIAATCNLATSLTAVGMTKTGLYALRRRDPVFAEQLRSAMLVGYERLEAELLRKAVAAFEDGDTGGAEKGDVIVEPMSVDQAMRLLERYQTSQKGSGGPGVREVRHRATQAETDAMLLEQLRILRRQREKRA
ncbi:MULTISPECIES: hypothetical protein [unclassified Sphingomonas]|uniref:hypothetical protein n=1 Tax=unclassified Sphingomonas TaxID=196159 RepID=UPI0007011812|nr:MULTISPECIES: hypothetical protein [unclassified Sphingomonas]KQM57910.1 hypothetical protein ASE65_12160 [Sphingomonas sp. Leaf16]KQN12804.1 hypothetical protein ASE81_05645 [Sphingomonas sp. Leaf29]KQN19692.1 hypothetical protein ASE83_05575 [Sphingomonas sp. Leaf32]